VQDWCGWPQQWQATAQVTHGVGSTVLLTQLVDDVHLVHELVIRQVGANVFHSLIVQRQEGESSAKLVETTNPAHATTTKVAVAIEYNDIPTRKSLWIWQFSCGFGGDSIHLRFRKTGGG